MAYLGKIRLIDGLGDFYHSEEAATLSSGHTISGEFCKIMNLGGFNDILMSNNGNLYYYDKGTCVYESGLVSSSSSVSVPTLLSSLTGKNIWNMSGYGSGSGRNAVGFSYNGDMYAGDNSYIIQSIDFTIPAGILTYNSGDKMTPKFRNNIKDLVAFNSPSNATIQYNFILTYSGDVLFGHQNDAISDTILANYRNEGNVEHATSGGFEKMFEIENVNVFIPEGTISKYIDFDGYVWVGGKNQLGSGTGSVTDTDMFPTRLDYLGNDNVIMTRNFIVKENGDLYGLDNGGSRVLSDLLSNAEGYLPSEYTTGTLANETNKFVDTRIRGVKFINDYPDGYGLHLNFFNEPTKIYYVHSAGLSNGGSDALWDTVTNGVKYFFMEHYKNIAYINGQNLGLFQTNNGYNPNLINRNESVLVIDDTEKKLYLRTFGRASYEYLFYNFSNTLRTINNDYYSETYTTDLLSNINSYTMYERYRDTTSWTAISGSTITKSVETINGVSSDFYYLRTLKDNGATDEYDYCVKLEFTNSIDFYKELTASGYRIQQSGGYSNSASFTNSGMTFKKGNTPIFYHSSITDINNFELNSIDVKNTSVGINQVYIVLMNYNNITSVANKTYQVIRDKIENYVPLYNDQNMSDYVYDNVTTLTTAYTYSLPQANTYPLFTIENDNILIKTSTAPDSWVSHGVYISPYTFETTYVAGDLVTMGNTTLGTYTVHGTASGGVHIMFDQETRTFGSVTDWEFVKSSTNATSDWVTPLILKKIGNLNTNVMYEVKGVGASRNASGTYSFGVQYGSTAIYSNYVMGFTDRRLIRSGDYWIVNDANPSIVGYTLTDSAYTFVYSENEAQVSSLFAGLSTTVEDWYGTYDDGTYTNSAFNAGNKYYDIPDTTNISYHTVSDYVTLYLDFTPSVNMPADHDYGLFTFNKDNWGFGVAGKFSTSSTLTQRLLPFVGDTAVDFSTMTAIYNTLPQNIQMNQRCKVIVEFYSDTGNTETDINVNFGGSLTYDITVPSFTVKARTKSNAPSALGATPTNFADNHFYGTIHNFRIFNEKQLSSYEKSIIFRNEYDEVGDVLDKEIGVEFLQPDVVLNTGNNAELTREYSMNFNYQSYYLSGFIGDPYIYPLLSPKFKLPAKETFYRLYDNLDNNNRFIINGETFVVRQKLSESIEHQIKNLYPENNYNDLKNIGLYGGCFMKKLYIKNHSEFFIIDLTTKLFKTNINNASQLVKIQHKVETNFDLYPNEKMISISLPMHNKHNKNIVIEMNFYQNPQVRNGFKVYIKEYMDKSNGLYSFYRNPIDCEIDNLENEEMLDYRFPEDMEVYDPELEEFKDGENPIINVQV